MKKIHLLIINAFFLINFPISVYSQLSTFHFGADIGYTANNFLTINASMSTNNWYYGLSTQVNMNIGTKGKSYDSIIGWDNHLDAVSDSGKYYNTSFGIDLGYYFLNNLCFGGGLGYTDHRLYRNFYDETGILHSAGWYHVTKSDGGKIEAKMFLNYYFKEGLLGNCYIRGQYSVIAGIGASVGFRF